LEIVDGEAAGTARLGLLGVPAAAKFAADGDATGCSPFGVIVCGEDCAVGSAGGPVGAVGVAARATTDESVGASAVFHHAQRGAD
jgi:hypothetical protein